MISAHARPHFHPHRVYPRRTRLVMGTSRVAGVTDALLRWTPRLILDSTPISSEDPRTSDVRSTRLVVCGLPRSGTTFLTRAGEIFLGGRGSVWKSHDPFVGRDFLPSGVPVIVLLRAPLETAISKAIFHEDQVTATSLMRRLALTTTWYRLMAHEPPHELLRAWDFAEVVADPSFVLESTLHQRSAAPLEAAAVVQEVSSDDEHQGVTSPQTHIPHADRTRLQARYESFAENARVHRYLSLALEAQEEVRHNHTP